MANKAPTADYSGADIDVLEGLEHVRKRVGMYLGSRDERGAYKAVDEIIDNSIDEHLAGFGKLVLVHYDLTTNFITIADQGRGIPVDIHPKTKEPTIMTVLGRLAAGGKFKEGSYEQSGGLNGVGASCTNAVSDSFEAWSYRNKCWNYLKFSQGKLVTKLTKSEPAQAFARSKQGTVIRFHLDPEIFGEHRVDPKRLCVELRDKAYLNPGLEIKAIVGGKSFHFVGEHGLLSMVYDEKRKESMLGKAWRLFEPKLLDVAVVWYDDDEVSIKSYVNSIRTHGDGTHVDGFKTALTKALRELSGTDFEPKYWMKGMHVALNWRMSEPDFYGQTKDQLGSPISSKLQEIVYPKLALWLKQNPNLVKRLAERANAFKKNEDKFKADNKAIKALEIGGKNDRAIDPNKLIQADSNVPPHLRELVLVEGDSSGGACRMARSPHHEILKLRGVSINAQRQSSARVLANMEIRLIIKSLGIKPGETDLSKMRVGSITILTDADPDGKHIASLLLAFFKVYYPEIVRQKKLRYISCPLFIGQVKDIRFFGDTREEVLEQFSAGMKANVRYTRLKGLGECQKLSSIIQTTRGFQSLQHLIGDQPLGWSELPEPFDVYDAHDNIRSVTRVFRKQERCLNIRAGGRLIEVTANHPFLSVVNGKLVWKRAGTLKLDDVVLLSRNGHFGSNEEFDTSWYSNVSDRSELSETPRCMTPELARLLGYLTADGSGTHIISTGMYRSVAEDIKYCFEKSFPGKTAAIVPMRAGRDASDCGYNVRLSSANYLEQFFASIGYRSDCTAYDKDVPWSVLESSKECVAAYIQGVMESDGYFGTQASGYIEHYTASKALASSMAVLFGMFGMHAPYTEELNVYNPFTKQYSDKDGYQMFMFGESIDLYLQHVGVRSKEKTWHFQALKKQLQSMKKKRNTNNDVLYGVKSALRATMDEKRTGLAGSRRFLVEGSVVELAIGFYSIATDITYPELERNSDYLENIRKLDPSIAKTLDYARALHPRFVKVEDIKKSNVVVDVGDIEVPESHSYIANGFVVHNCNAEQLEVMAFAPETRRLTILTMNDSDEATIEAVMGKDVEHRKEMLFGSTNVDGEE